MSADRPLRDELDLFLLLPHFSRFLAFIREIAPAPIADAAMGLAEAGAPAWQHAIEDFWHGEPGIRLAPNSESFEAGSGAAISSDQLLAWIFLQPYAEYLADHRETTIVDGAPSTCPVCGGRPIAGALRPEGDGAKKAAHLHALRARVEEPPNQSSSDAQITFSINSPPAVSQHFFWT